MFFYQSSGNSNMPPDNRDLLVALALFLVCFLFVFGFTLLVYAVVG